MANNFKFRNFNKANKHLGIARPFDSQYAHSILTGSVGAAAFSPYKAETPNGYTWHHVYMGWCGKIDKDKLDELKLQGLDTLNTLIHLGAKNSQEEITVKKIKEPAEQPVKKAGRPSNDKRQAKENDLRERTKEKKITYHIYDASKWNTNTDTDIDKKWNPLENFALMQLVYTNVHKFCGNHAGCVAQYKNFMENKDGDGIKNRCYCAHKKEKGKNK